MSSDADLQGVPCAPPAAAVTASAPIRMMDAQGLVNRTAAAMHSSLQAARRITGVDQAAELHEGENCSFERIDVSGREDSDRSRAAQHTAAPHAPSRLDAIRTFSNVRPPLSAFRHGVQTKVAVQMSSVDVQPVEGPPFA